MSPAGCRRADSCRTASDGYRAHVLDQGRRRGGVMSGRVAPPQPCMGRRCGTVERRQYLCADYKRLTARVTGRQAERDSHLLLGEALGHWPPSFSILGSQPRKPRRDRRCADDTPRPSGAARVSRDAATPASRRAGVATEALREAQPGGPLKVDAGQPTHSDAGHGPCRGSRLMT